MTKRSELKSHAGQWEVPAFYEPDQEGLNGSVWVFDTDKGTVLEKYDNVCYEPVKMFYKKR